MMILHMGLNWADTAATVKTIRQTQAIGMPAISFPVKVSPEAIIF